MSKFKDYAISIFKKFNEKPENIDSKMYRFFILSNYLYALFGLIHFSFIFLFSILGFKLLAVFNIASTFIFIAVIYLNHNGYIKTAFVIATFEILIHPALASYYIGDVGLRHALLFLLMLGFIFPTKETYRKIAIGAFICLCYAAMNYYEHIYNPVFELPSYIFLSLNVAVSLLAAFISCFMAHYFQTAASTAEEALEKEYKRSEKLLLNVLPKTIAEELKSGAKVIADKFQNTTLLFADIVGFTSFSEKISPEKLVDILNQVFSLFDKLIDKYDMEKIKTIGDAYMVAGGVPTQREDHAKTIADLSLGMIEELSKYNKENDQSFQIRIGIHSGPVVAGVIGIKKFIYDVWGDTVNIASRMESHGVPGRIQVSEQTYTLLKDNYDLESRGEIEIKGKGKLPSYFLLGKK